eukprot:scaffold798_cov142-Skeletonema_dohrnii-CCMP3373.AAC.7
MSSRRFYTNSFLEEICVLQSCTLVAWIDMGLMYFQATKTWLHKQLPQHKVSVLMVVGVGRQLVFLSSDVLESNSTSSNVCIVSGMLYHPELTLKPSLRIIMCIDVASSLDEHISAPFSTPKAEKNTSGMSKIVDGDHANGSKQRFQQLDSIRGELFSATKVGACTC